MRLYRSIAILCFMMSLQSFAQTSTEQDAEYTKTITLRAEKIVEPLHISNPEVAIHVRDIIIQQYRKLNEIHTAKENKLKSAEALKNSNKDLSAELSENAENEAKAGLYNLHFDYLARLMLYLDDAGIEQVKDGMTYGVLPVTYKGYCDMVLDLTDEQKRQIKVWLIEARELAMDAGSSDEKHKWFGKYKGRINNYLSAAGYNMKKEGEEWQKRLKDPENKIAK